MILRPETSTLLIIDLQERLMPAIPDHPSVVANAVRLAKAARILDVPVFATEQNPAGLGPNVLDVRGLAIRTLEKQYFDATRKRLVLTSSARSSKSYRCRMRSSRLRSADCLRHEGQWYPGAVGQRRDWVSPHVESRCCRASRRTSWGRADDDRDGHLRMARVSRSPTLP